MQDSISARRTLGRRHPSGAPRGEQPEVQTQPIPMPPTSSPTDPSSALGGDLEPRGGKDRREEEDGDRRNRGAVALAVAPSGVRSGRMK
jgi:hypothetical protein